jgi:hypothetical protein
MRNRLARSAGALFVIHGLATAACGSFTIGVAPGEEAPGEEVPAAPPSSPPGHPSGDNDGEPTASIPPWSHRFGEGGWQESKAIAVDADGGVAVAGRFVGTLDFGQGPLPSSSEGFDVFVARLDARGIAVWSRSLGGHEAEALGVAMDKDGNVIVTGYFFGTIDAGGGPLTSAGDDDIFVAKFDALGNHVFSKSFGGESHQSGVDVAVDAGGNIVVTGQDWDGVDFGGGPLGGYYGKQAFVVKLDPAGDHVFSKRFSGLGRSLGKGLAVDGDGNILVTGTARGPVDLGGGPLPYTNSDDVFLVKLDASGDHLWSKVLGESGYLFSQRVAVDSARNVVILGTFGGVVDLGGGPHAAMGNQDTFLAKYDPDGVYLWSQAFGGAPNAYAKAHGVAIDSSHRILLAGAFTGSVDFGGGALVNGGEDDVFVAKLDGSGNHLGSASFGGAELQGGWAIGATATGEAVLTGYFMNTVDFGGGPLTAGGAADLFVAKLAP